MFSKNFRELSEIEICRKRLSITMQFRASLTLVWPGTHAEFENIWRRASSVVAKGYATPRFIGVCAAWVPVDIALEKNSDEIDAYLEVLRADDYRLDQTRYIQEIQMKKHGHSLVASLAKAEKFRHLAKSIERDGIRRPIFLADVAEFDLPYRMFRFDGNHRAICAKHLGLEMVPAFVFKVNPP